MHSNDIRIASLHHSVSTQTWLSLPLQQFLLQPCLFNHIPQSQRRVITERVGFDLDFFMWHFKTPVQSSCFSSSLKIMKTEIIINISQFFSHLSTHLVSHMLMQCLMIKYYFIKIDIIIIFLVIAMMDVGS